MHLSPILCLQVQMRFLRVRGRFWGWMSWSYALWNLYLVEWPHCYATSLLQLQRHPRHEILVMHNKVTHHIIHYTLRAYMSTYKKMLANLKFMLQHPTICYTPILLLIQFFKLFFFLPKVPVSTCTFLWARGFVILISILAFTEKFELYCSNHMCLALTVKPKAIPLLWCPL